MCFVGKRFCFCDLLIVMHFCQKVIHVFAVFLATPKGQLWSVEIPNENCKANTSNTKVSSLLQYYAVNSTIGNDDFAVL